MLNPLISIIVPIYNVELFLRDCLNSIKHQSYSNFECICVIDGATDNSISIADDFAREDPRFIVISQKNKGLAGARNTGIINSRGDYIAFVDSDDMIDINMFELFFNQLQLSHCDYLACTHKAISEKEKYKEQLWINTPINAKDKEKIHLSNSPFSDVLNNTHPYNVSACMHLFKTSLLEGILFPEEMKMHEDTCFSMQVLFNSKSAVHIDLPLYLYRERPGSITRSNSYTNSAYHLEKNILQGSVFATNNRLNKENFNSLILKCGVSELSNIALALLLNNSLPKAERTEAFQSIKYIINSLRKKSLFPLSDLIPFIKTGIFLSYYLNLPNTFRFIYSIIWKRK